METASANELEPPVHRGLHEDWTAAIVGVLIFVAALGLALLTKPKDLDWQTPSPAKLTSAEKAAGKKREAVWPVPLKGWIGKLSTWKADPLAAFRPKPKTKPKPSKESSPDAKQSLPETKVENPGPYQWHGILGAFIGTLVAGCLACVIQRNSGKQLFRFAMAFVALFALSTFSFALAAQEVLEAANLEYALWALLVGLLIANTLGTPAWMKPAMRGELFIKIGLILLGAEVLFSRLLELGLPGVFVSWVVTPIVLISTYIFGQRVLKMESRSLNLVISADMSVCGVSAAIATAAACKAKKEELSLAIGLSLIFTVAMMVAMPKFIVFVGMDPVVGGAWLGGTIDSTGAVAAAASSKELGPIALETAVTVKMIQNILIGVTAVGVAIYWTRWVEPTLGDKTATANSVGIGEIWRRFPKFVFGFLAASIIASSLYASSYYGQEWLGASVDGITKQLRTWLFCLAFVCIGLETNFVELLPYLRSGKPLILYLCGQALNLLLSLLMALLMFGWLFPPNTGAQ